MEVANALLIAIVAIAFISIGLVNHRVNKIEKRVDRLEKLIAI